MIYSFSGSPRMSQEKPLDTNSMKRCISSFLTAILFLPVGAAYAETVKGYTVIGGTIDIGIDSLLKDIRGELTRKEIESVGVMVTNRYHEAGYTACYVERIVLRRDGTLEIHVREPKIAGINVTGVDDVLSDKIQRLLLPAQGEVYNRLILIKRAEEVKAIFNLSAMRINPVNYQDTDDIFLAVNVEKKVTRWFYGGIGIEPIYGVTPQLGFYYPFKTYAVNILAEAGYKSGEFRKVKGDIRFYLFSGDNLAFYAGYYELRLIDTWETRKIDYTSESHAPVAGIKYSALPYYIDLYYREILSDLDGYSIDAYRNYDSRITVDLRYSNKRSIIDRKHLTSITLSLSGGRSSLGKNGYGIFTFDLSIPMALAPWLRIIPKIDSYFTTSSDRFYWSYVYDKNFLGFFNNYTASRSKNIAGFDIDFEISPEFLYAGPFINGGYFLDEEKKWKSGAGTGINCRIYYKKIDVVMYYAWDVTRPPSKGGFYIFAESAF